MKIVVIDGQGGKIGKAVIEQLRARNCTDYILAVGTNSIATSAMLKAGADAKAADKNGRKRNGTIEFFDGMF